MFSYMQLNDRRREIYTERALGMKLHQISTLFFIEGIILIISSVLIGSFLGVFLMLALSLFITSGQQIPSYDVIIPPDLVGLTYFFLIILAVLSSLIPAYYVSKQDISKGFAGEI